MKRVYKCLVEYKKFISTETILPNIDLHWYKFMFSLESLELCMRDVY